MITGETDIIVLYLEQADGTALTYASKALFQAAGFDLTWYDEAGIALVSQPTWTLPIAGAAGRHQFAYEIPDGPWTVKVTEPSTHISTPKELTGEGEAYDLGGLGSLIASSGSTTIAPTLTTDSAIIFDGDSIYVAGISVTETALAAIGASSLADCTSRKAYIKLDSEDAGDVPIVIDTDLTVTATSDSNGNRVLKVEKTAFPVGLAIADGQRSVAATLHVRLEKSSKKIVAAQVNLTIQWPAPEGALP